MSVFAALWVFIKNPVYREDEHTDPKYRWKVFAFLLILSLLISMSWGFLLSMGETLIEFDLGEHALEKAFEDYSLWAVFILAIVVAPIIEELVFRAPMVLFKGKGYFKIVFWVLTLLFGFVHLTNYEITSSIMIFSLFLVLPQIVLGALLGFIRVRFGLIWAIGLHAVYNLILLGPVLLMTALDIPIPTE